jgi:hypothetical protein
MHERRLRTSTRIIESGVLSASGALWATRRGERMAGRPALPRRLFASVVLLGIAVLFFALAALFYARGAQWANEFSGVAGFFVALAALFSPLARAMLRWMQQGSVELATIPPEQAGTLRLRSARWRSP